MITDKGKLKELEELTGVLLGKFITNNEQTEVQFDTTKEGITYRVHWKKDEFKKFRLEAAEIVEFS